LGAGGATLCAAITRNSTRGGQGAPTSAAAALAAFSPPSLTPAHRLTPAAPPNAQRPAPLRVPRHAGDAEASRLPRPCFFVDKAWHAQQAGADAVLVVNDRGGELSTAVSPRDDEGAAR
jgi:hypothetical protein